MSTSGEKASQLAVALIEEQLRTLPVSIAATLEVFEVDVKESALLAKLVLNRKPRVVRTGSGGNIVAAKAEAYPPLDFQEATQTLGDVPFHKLDHLRVLVGNSLLAVGYFLREHNMLDMRTPEVQFLSHSVNAILNANILNIPGGHIPVASFDGLVIDATSNGKPLFDSHDAEGLIALGDAIALLQWLGRYLRGEKNYISGGDAG